MSSKLPLALTATALFLAAIHVSAQEAAQPLQSMPYSPSLDLTSLDRSADPCIDFYKFSCGGWEKNNPIPADQSGWSVYAKLGNENQQFLWGILEADAKATNRDAGATEGRRLLCRLHEYLGDRCVGSEARTGGLARIDALKTRPELIAAISTLHHDYAGNFFFGSGTDQDAIDSSLVIVSCRGGWTWPA